MLVFSLLNKSKIKIWKITFTLKMQNYTENR